VQPTPSELHLEKLIRGGRYRDLIELSQALRQSKFCQRDADDLALPPEAFLLIELLHWLAVGVRTGTWEYYDTTARGRQVVMSAALRTFAPRDYAAVYDLGMHAKLDDAKLAKVDAWIITNEAPAQVWLAEFVRGHRPVMLRVGALAGRASDGLA